jgi:hypothetical protein
MLEFFEVLFSLVGFGLGLYQLYLWRSEREFYRKNNWDWSIDTKESNTMFGGPPGSSGTKMMPMNNRTRVTFGYPLSAAILLFVSVVSFLFILGNIQ